MAKAKVITEGLNAVESTAISKVKAAGELTPGDHNIDVYLHVTGCLRKGEDYESTPTRKIPTLKALALAVKRMGFQREKFIEILNASMVEAIEGADTADIEADIADTEKIVRDMLGELPKTKCSGPVTLVGDLVVEKVETEIAAIRG